MLIFLELTGKLFNQKYYKAVPDSQYFDWTSNSTVAKLLEVDCELAVTEAELLSQLESVQSKRRSLKTVLSLFPESGTPATLLLEEPAQISVETEQSLEPVDEELAASPLEASREPATADVETKAAPDIDSNRARKGSNSSTRSNKTTKLKPATKTAKRTSGWQEYVREEFSHTSLPEVVALVLKRQADAVLEIPTVVNAIFVEEMPQEARRQARRQVTNILGNGVLKGKWYRGQLGSYSMSRAAVQAT